MGCAYTHHNTVRYLEKTRRLNPLPEDDATTAETTPCIVVRVEQIKGRGAYATQNGTPHIKLGRLRLKTWSNMILHW